MTQAVLYAAKSTEDTKGSIATQLAQTRERAEAEQWTVAGEFTDEKKSAYKGSRGEGLAAALALCEQLGAGTRLIIQHSDRLARGSGKEAKHLVEYTIWAIKHSVQIVSLQDPEMFPEGDMAHLMGAIGGMRNFEDSKRKSKSIRDGRRRQWERGEWPSAPTAGYKFVWTVDEDGNRVKGSRRLVKDDTQEAAVNRLFDLALEHRLPPAEISRILNAEGYRTRKNKPWERDDVKRIAMNVFYAGVMSWNGETKGGSHEPYITPEQHEQLVAQMRQFERGYGGGSTTGRRATEHLLFRLAVCHKCGGRMFAERSWYERKDGTRQRVYTCSHRRKADGLCDVVVDAEVVDRGVERWLGRLLGDFDAIREHVLNNTSGQRSGAQRYLDEALADAERIAKRIQRGQQGYERYLDEGRDDMAEEALKAVVAARENQKAAQRRIDACRTVVEGLEETALANEILDMANRLRAEDVPSINAALQAEFLEFRIAVYDNLDADVELPENAEQPLFPGDNPYIMVVPVARPVASTGGLNAAEEYERFTAEHPDVLHNPVFA